VAAVPVDRRSDCGIVSLNAMAVLRLITSWNCAICSSSGQVSMLSFHSRITTDLTTPSRMNGSCLEKASAASRVLKIAMLPGSNADDLALCHESVHYGLCLG
jgi:hypothetical protein